MATITPNSAVKSATPDTPKAPVAAPDTKAPAAPDTTKAPAQPAVAPVDAAPATRGVSQQAKEALAAYQTAQKEAKKIVIEFLYANDGNDAKSLPERVRKALEVLVPNKAQKKSGATSRGAKASLLDQLSEMFLSAKDGKVSLMDIFKRFRMGEGEMRIRIRNLIYDRKPEDRLWVSYNADSETYTLEGTGPTAPKGWTGVLPKTKPVK